MRNLRIIFDRGLEGQSNDRNPQNTIRDIADRHTCAIAPLRRRHDRSSSRDQGANRI
jgi:hypothetical protein